VAERESADLMVIGKQGLARDNGLEFGSSVDSLLRLAPLPVLVVPAGRNLQRGPVVVGVDLTEPSLLAALAGIRFAAAMQTDTLLVHVVPDLPTLPRWREHAERAIEQRDADAARDLDLAVRALPKLAPLSLHIDGGSIPRRLVEAARARDAAMLVLGRQVRPHGYGPPGAIAYRVLTLANVPVLMHVAVA
jgi:nucleotide-binding universal stress UspA family protein